MKPFNYMVVPAQMPNRPDLTSYSGWIAIDETNIPKGYDYRIVTTSEGMWNFARDNYDYSVDRDGWAVIEIWAVE